MSNNSYKHGLGIISTLIILLGSGGCGNTYFYRVSDDLLAQKARTSYSEADFKSVIGSERVAVANFSAREQTLVNRNQRTLRDRELIGLLTGSNSWDQFQKFIEGRYDDLFGSDCNQGQCVSNKYPKIKGNIDLLKFADKHLEPLRREYALFTNGTVNLQCPVAQIQRPRDEQVALINRFNNFSEACRDLQKATNNLQELADPESKLGKISLKLINIEREMEAQKNFLDTAKKKYLDALNALKASKEKGPLDDTLNQAVKELETVGDLETSVLTNDYILKGLADAGKLEKIKEQKKLIDDLIQALKGNAPENAEPALALVTAFSGEKKEQSTNAMPLVSTLILQAEFLRLEGKRLEKNIARAQERIALYKKQRDAMYDETLYLYEASSSLENFNKDTSCVKKATVYQSFVSSSSDCRLALARALSNYSHAITLGRIEQEIIDYQLIAQGHDAVLDSSEIAFAQTDNLIKISIEQLAVIYAGGIKPEDIAAVAQALGVAAIAVGVY
jgi:hypothetical protein